MLMEIALSYLEMKKGSELAQLLNKASPPLPKTKALLPLTILEISEHRTLKVAQWLQTEKKLSETTLNAFFYCRRNKQGVPLALYISKLILQKHPTVQSKANYGLAWFK